MVGKQHLDERVEPMLAGEETQLLLPGVPLDCTALPLHLSRPKHATPISTVKKDVIVLDRREWEITFREDASRGNSTTRGYHITTTGQAGLQGGGERRI